MDKTVRTDSQRLCGYAALRAEKLSRSEADALGKRNTAEHKSYPR